MTCVRVATLAALIVCCARPVAAQAVRLEFHDGKVNLTTQNASVRAILTEWARLGGTQVVNADRINGAPLTLQLTDVAETQALDIVLRGVAGYIAGERTAAGPVATGTRSSLDRILIVPTAGTASVAPVRPGVTPPPFVQQVPQPFIQPDPDDNPASDVPPEDDRRPRPVPPVLRLVQPGNQPAPQPSPVDDDQPTPPAGTQQAPANPFGIQTGTSRPGMVTPGPAPQPQRPQNTRDQEP